MFTVNSEIFHVLNSLGGGGTQFLARVPNSVCRKTRALVGKKLRTIGFKCLSVMRASLQL